MEGEEGVRGGGCLLCQAVVAQRDPMMPTTAASCSTYYLYNII